MDNAITPCPAVPIPILFYSAGPETQAMTHTDGGAKCAVQVSSVKKSQIKV